MADIRAQVILHTKDAVPENYVSNSWAFNGIDPGTDDSAIVTMLKDFYDDITYTYWSAALAQNGHTVKLSVLPGRHPTTPTSRGRSTWPMTRSTRDCQQRRPLPCLSRPHAPLACLRHDVEAVSTLGRSPLQPTRPVGR